MASEPLVQACEVAFEVARRGWEANPPVEPPAPMRSFIYLPQLPRRAMTVAQRVMDEDPEFRARVASAATEARVGRAGHLWLHRPPGWEATFGMLTGGSPTVAPPLPVAPAPVPASSGLAAPGLGTAAPVTVGVGVGGQAPPPPPPPAPRPSSAGSPVPRPQPTPPAPSSQRPSSGSDTIENELANLRDLVGRLTDEREHLSSVAAASAAGTPATPVAAPAPPPPGRDASQQLQRDLENRVVTLEAQLRAATSQLDERATEGEQTAASLAAAETELVGLRASADRLERDNQSLRSEVESLGIERDAARADATRYQREHAVLVADSDSAARQLEALARQVDELNTSTDAALAEATTLRAEHARQQERFDAVDRGRADLEAELADVSSKWQRLQAGASDLTQRNAALEAELDQLRRLRESAEAERRALFSDLAVQLSRVEAERDLLASQLGLANGRLQGTRRALESATRSVSEELDACEGAFGQTQQAADAVHAAVAEAGRRLDLLSESLDDAGASRSGGNVEPEVVMNAVPNLGGELSEPVGVDDGAEEDVHVPEEASDLEDVLATYGLGAGMPESFDSAGFDAAGFDAAAFESAAPDSAGFEPERFDSGSLEFETFEPDRFDSERFDTGLVDSESAQPELFEPASSDVPSFDPNSAAPSTDPGAPEVVLAAASEAAPEHVAPDQPGSSTSRRARVSLITGDPLTVARHTVTTAEVVLLIDGDPVAAMGWPMLGPIERRDALVGNLGDLVGDTGAAADVVFDGKVAGDEQLPSAPAVRVRLTSADVDPANAISGLLDAYPLQWPIAVVTDNPRLAQAARDLGASVLDNGQLLDLFITP